MEGRSDCAGLYRRVWLGQSVDDSLVFIHFRDVTIYEVLFTTLKLNEKKLAPKRKKPASPIDEKGGWQSQQTETEEGYLEGVVAGAFSVVDLDALVVFLLFLVFLVDVDFVLVVDLSSAAKVPRLIDRANMATIIKENNFFMELPPLMLLAELIILRPGLNLILFSFMSTMTARE